MKISKKSLESISKFASAVMIAVFVYMTIATAFRYDLSVSQLVCHRRYSTCSRMVRQRCHDAIQLRGSTG